MTATNGVERKARTVMRPAAISVAAAAAVLLWTAVLAGPPEEAVGLCTQDGKGYTTAASGQLTKDTRLLFQAGYKYSDWTGYLRAKRLSEGALNDKWAAALIPPAADRKIQTWSGTQGVPFTVDGIKSVAGVSWPGVFAPSGGDDGDDEAEKQAAKVVAYLRGDPADEGGAFRRRSSRLGAIVSSEMAYSGAENFGYEALGGDVATKYRTFLQSKLAKLDKGTDQLVVVGANDGMLHGFDPDTGVEKFAYVPRALLVEPISDDDKRSTLVRLTDPDVKRRYYVDGSPWVGDAYLGDAWRTVVVGTGGAGARTVFAIDITNPAAVKVLWELDSATNSSLGYAFGQPVVGRLNDGNYYAIFGNGRESSGACAVLFLVRLDNGQAMTISTGVCGGNGLGRPSLFDNQVAGEAGYRITDYVYAGDLKGNVWKFNLTSVKSAEWAVAFGDRGGPLPLFTAKNADGVLQPITGVIEIGPPPPNVEQAKGSPRPAMLWFGTGRYFASADAADKSVQSMYGILDRGTGVINSPGDNAAKSREKLVAQTVTSTSTVDGVKVGKVSTNTIDYKATGDNEKRGWYIDLVRVGEEAKGERMTGLPLFQGLQLVFPTITPEADACAGTSSIYAVDPYTGGALASGKKFFLRAAIASYDFIGVKADVGMVRNLVYTATSASGYLFAAGASGQVQTEQVLKSQQDTSRGRVSWREIVK